jgi:hypothetical protein
MLALISVLPKLLYMLYTSSWNGQMLKAEQLLPGSRQHGLPFPSAHDGTNSPCYPPAELARMPIRVNTLAFCLIFPQIHFRKYIFDHILNGIFIVLGTLSPEDCPLMSSELLRYPFLIHLLQLV